LIENSKRMICGGGDLMIGILEDWNNGILK
jgi:hypothetical protein